MALFAKVTPALTLLQHGARLQRRRQPHGILQTLLAGGTCELKPAYPPLLARTPPSADPSR
eukprot:3052997-Lingulodinium_polyedra.AAC.1